MIITLTPKERDYYRSQWRYVLSETLIDGHWVDVPAVGDWIVLSAWDPFGEMHTDLQNRRISQMLIKPKRETPVRSWRMSHWAKDGWLFEYKATFAIREVRRLNQLAAFAFLGGVRHLLWNSGELEEFTFDK